MQGDEFFSTWVANKAVYRTRMAIADGGELLIIAPGLKRFGEQEDVDQLAPESVCERLLSKFDPLAKRFLQSDDEAHDCE